jgi:ATP-dependent DNA helicase RecQ
LDTVAFIDTEIDAKSGKILDIGCIKNNGYTFHKSSLAEFADFLKGSNYICGHNIINHDLKYINNVLERDAITSAQIIDTLYFSPLLFPTRPYHALVKDDKLQTEENNNPLNDAIKARDLFYDELEAFRYLDNSLKHIFYLLLKDRKEFGAFFHFIRYESFERDTELLIRSKFDDYICAEANLERIIEKAPVELAYCISLISSFVENKKTHSITPPWVLRNYPDVERIMYRLRSKPCIQGCTYCNSVLDSKLALKRYFGYDKYRSFDGQPLQEQAVNAAIANKSILAVFPTGGGKSITFQVPALLCGEVSKALTIVISPLQSLMKDQVDNLEKIGITDAVTINGLLDPIERAKAFERVEDGSASLLYISPESLRSKTIERLLLGRKIARFVIDEAHCFSSWGQDFRVDYLYIGDFIKSIQDKKNLEEGIPVSCFTATAKQKVIEDIINYFNEKLNVDLELFTSKSSRTNLQYRVYQKGNEEDKYLALRDLLESKDCPTIVYVSRTRKASLLAERLIKDGFNATAYHGKMDKQEKSLNQNAFINGEIQIMVATSAFGMGVDKKDVGKVIHYEISDSLENYVQEAGRAGRDENITADCYVLFNEEDLSKHFILLNQTKLSIKEIQQIWKAIKDITKFRSMVSNSALEIARKAGWDDNVVDIETRVTTAIAALEDAGYLKRGQNMPRVFANSILSKNAIEAIDKIMSSDKFEPAQKDKAIRIIKKLFSSKSGKQNEDEIPDSRVDYISDHLGIPKDEVINIVNLLREVKILADAKDLTAFIKCNENKNRSLQILSTYSKIENFLLLYLDLEEKIFHIKELNEDAEKADINDVSTNKIKNIINFWAIKHWIKRKNLSSRNHIAVHSLVSLDNLKERLQRRYVLSRFIVEFLFDKLKENVSREDSDKEEILVQFSVHELKQEYEGRAGLFQVQISIADIEDSLFYLSRIEAIKIEGGFLVVYNRLTIERKEHNNKKQYTKEDYEKLNQFYEGKVQQIHIVGEYAKKMIDDYKSALHFVEDYFQLNYTSFLYKYFKGDRLHEIRRSITPNKFKQLFGELSPTQLKIINDKESKYIVVAAGPGSGKTRILVHKLASLLLMEDVKHEQLLMITFSRAAATEFKKRLLKLIGNAANFIEIKTFHSYCFDLLGRVGSLEKSREIIRKATELIRNNDVEISRITKTVLVIDEAQDMDSDEFELIKALIDRNEDMRVIAVGDDDQNIYEFRGANVIHLEQLMSKYHAVKYELVENYRSKQNLVEFANLFVTGIKNRLKQTPIIPKQNELGKIKIVSYQSNNLIYPTVNDILHTDLAGSTCVLTRTNDEALQITGLLLKNNLKAKLIQTNEGFNLYNLFEVRYFLQALNLTDKAYTIHEEVWNNAKQAALSNLKRSSKIEILQNIIIEFEASHPKTKYKSDLEVFIKESQLEDLYTENSEIIFVSTIHKAKGKEFDNVFLMLDNYTANTDEEKRLLYVAITRAKQNLIIHQTGQTLSFLQAENLVHLEDKSLYQSPNELAMHLTHRDIWLSFLSNRQHSIANLSCGDELKVEQDGCKDKFGNYVVKFSKQFMQQLPTLAGRNYKLKKAKINFKVYWKDEKSNKEIKVILPELYFEKL